MPMTPPTMAASTTDPTAADRTAPAARMPVRGVASSAAMMDGREGPFFWGTRTRLRSASSGGRPKGEVVSRSITSPASSACQGAASGVRAGPARGSRPVQVPAPRAVRVARLTAAMARPPAPGSGLSANNEATPEPVIAISTLRRLARRASAVASMITAASPRLGHNRCAPHGGWASSADRTPIPQSAARSAALGRRDTRATTLPSAWRPWTEAARRRPPGTTPSGVSWSEAPARVPATTTECPALRMAAVRAVAAGSSSGPVRTASASSTTVSIRSSRRRARASMAMTPRAAKSRSACVAKPSRPNRAARGTPAINTSAVRRRSRVAAKAAPLRPSDATETRWA